MYKKISKYMYINKAKDTVRRARISKKSLGSDVGEIKKMLEKFKKNWCITKKLKSDIYVYHSGAIYQDISMTIL